MIPVWTAVLSLALATSAEGPIVVENAYWAKPGLEEAVYRHRLYASEVRRDLGLAVGRVLRLAEEAEGRPDVVWQCEYESLAARELDLQRLQASGVFEAVTDHMGTLTVRFERTIWKVGQAAEAAAPNPYLGQEPPREGPVLFAPGLVNTDAIELNGVVSPDGREFFFTRVVDGDFIMHFMRLVDGEWTSPRAFHPYAGHRGPLAVDMAYSPDGRSLYFLGRFAEGAGEPNAEPGLDIWVSELGEDGEWQPASRVPAPVSTEASDYYPTVVADGSLYFTSDRPGGLGGGDVYRAQRLPDGGFAEPVNLGAPVNTEHWEGDTYVAPDESWLVVSSRRPGGYGQNDLYVSFRAPGGGWTEPVNLGAGVNTELTDFCPMGTPDGRYLFFSRRHGASWEEATAGDVLWMPVERILELRP